MKKTVIISCSCLFSCFFFNAGAQQSPVNLGEIHGNFQFDGQYYFPDSAIGTTEVPEKALTNGFLNINYSRDNFSAGFRYESYLNALQGYDPKYQGSGIMYRYVSYTAEKLEVTGGSFYEQFGNGLTLRAYEDRGLGFDNALEGFRVRYNPVRGVYLKGVWGRQRKYFEYGKGIVRGVDGEINLNELIPGREDKQTSIILGGSFVSKYEPDLDPLLNLPQNVGVSAGRMNINSGKIGLVAEYAYKINDPSTENGNIYKPGEAVFVAANYSQKGLGISLSGKRVDNMGFRSERSATGFSLPINYIPALTRQHTYSLLAFYPYSTNPKNEIGYQAEIVKKIKPWKADILINYSGVFGLDTTVLNDLETDRNGYSSSFMGAGEKIYQDVNIEMNKKISSRTKFTAVYSYQYYNRALVDKPGSIPVEANIGVFDITHKLTDTLVLRLQFEALITEQDKGDWAAALAEFSINPKWFFALQDQYNFGNYDEKKRIHYLNFSAGYIRNATRIQLGYGRQREGIFCVGGVCRQVPAISGFSLTITSTF